MNWDSIEKLVASLGTDAFSRTFFNFWDQAIDIDQCTSWKIHPQHAPLTLVSERPGEKEKIEKLCHLYTDNMHNSDPQIQSANQEVVVSGVSARKMEAGEYRRVLFEEADLQEKIFVLCQYNDGAYYINLYRRQGRRSFTEKEIEQCRTLATVATAFLDKHVALLPQKPPIEQHSSNLLEELNSFFSAHPAKLSQREAATCAYIVTGHSNEAIALHLGVSLNTVRTFRRRAYAKLNLATQSELFALFLENSGH